MKLSAVKMMTPDEKVAAASGMKITSRTKSRTVWFTWFQTEKTRLVVGTTRQLDGKLWISLRGSR